MPMLCDPMAGCQLPPLGPQPRCTQQSHHRGRGLVPPMTGERWLLDWPWAVHAALCRRPVVLRVGEPPTLPVGAVGSEGRTHPWESG